MIISRFLHLLSYKSIQQCFTRRKLYRFNLLTAGIYKQPLCLYITMISAGTKMPCDVTYLVIKHGMMKFLEKLLDLQNNCIISSAH